MLPAHRPGLAPATIAPAFAWVGVLSVLGAVQFLLARACGYRLEPVLAYAGYFFFYVYAPGVVALRFVLGARVSFAMSLALGVPTGFALEIFTYLGLSALGAKPLLPYAPLPWLVLGAWGMVRRRESPLRLRFGAAHAGIALSLAWLFLATVLAAVSNMFAESPLVAGLPQRPVFHDWVYLVSRAAAIKHLWPLEDPSLAGTPLQYHYFMLVHAASASWVTGLELTQVLLRLSVIPLGAVLVAQGYVLGRRLSGSAWGGVLTVLLTVLATELAFTPRLNESVFLGRFVRWLYVSPTFYFGMIFFGALLLALARWQQRTRPRARELAWICLIGAAATGAKGTVLPVLLPALVLWAGWRWWRSGRLPWSLVLAGLGLLAVFGIVYRLTMAGWGTGAAALHPFSILEVSDFWQQRFPRWAEWLGHYLPAGWAAPLASTACAAVILAGTLGLSLLAFPQLFAVKPRPGLPWMEWVGAAFLSCAAMGLVLRLDAHSELYVFLMIRLPAAALTAAFVVTALRRARAACAPGSEDGRGRLALGVRRVVPHLIGALVVTACLVQVGFWAARQRVGLAEWTQRPRWRKVEENMARLQEAMHWVRLHTDRRALLVANACTPANLAKDRWGALDGTLAGVHYYYSALSERRVLVEGPLYLLDPVRVRRRMALAAEVFYRRRVPTAEMFGSEAGYLLIDRAIGDGASVELPPSARVFSNSRVDIYRLPSGGGPRTTALATEP